MPKSRRGRRAKPPRLYYRADDDVWIILDRDRQIRTGFGLEETKGAADALSDYIAGKHKPAVGTSDPTILPIADVLTAYEMLKRPPGFGEPRPPEVPEPDTFPRHRELIWRLEVVNTFFGDKQVAEIKTQLCRDYVDWCTGTANERNKALTARKRRVAAATARRELEDLRAAVNAYHADHVLAAVPTVTLPPRGPARDRWLTRTEAARLLGAALGFVWDRAAGTWKRERGRLVRRDRVTRTRRRHAARFILVGLYSARREQTIRRTQWMPSATGPWFDLERWIYHGKGREERATKKRRPPAKVAYRLRPHLARWRRLDQQHAGELGRPFRYVVHRPDGRPLRGKIRTGWEGILADAALGDDVVRHILRHTAATWQMQAGTDLWSAAGFLGMTVEQLEDGYGHHHPDFQEVAAAAFGR
jgi:hypothetical protein